MMSFSIFFGGVGAVIDATGQFFLVQLDQFSGFEGLFFQARFFLLGAVANDDVVRPAEIRAFLDPPVKLPVFGHAFHIITERESVANAPHPIV